MHSQINTELQLEKYCTQSCNIDVVTLKSTCYVRFKFNMSKFYLSIAMDEPQKRGVSH